MGYQTVFDLEKVGYQQWPFAVVCLLLVAGAWFALLRPKGALSRLSKRERVFLGWGLGVFGGLAVLFLCVGTLSEYLSLRSAIQLGDTQVVEGKVENYSAPKNGYERYTVDGVLFEYSDDAIVAGFNHTKSR
ncbi:MAG: hypothetical protein AB2L09_03155 [Coriobacteriia bacterium]